MTNCYTKFDGIIYKVHCAAMTQLNHLTLFGKIICINYENYLKHILLDEVQG